MRKQQQASLQYGPSAWCQRPKSEKRLRGKHGGMGCSCSANQLTFARLSSLPWLGHFLLVSVAGVMLEIQATRPSTLCAPCRAWACPDHGQWMQGHNI